MEVEAEKYKETGAKRLQQNGQRSMGCTWSGNKSNLNENEGETEMVCAEDNIARRVECMNTAILRAIDEHVPDKEKNSHVRRRVSDATRGMYEERARRFSKIVAQGGEVSRSMRKRWQRKICQANLADYNDWLKQTMEKMEKAHGQGDTREVFKLVKIISGTQKTYAGTAPTIDVKDERILEQQRLAEVWKEFLEGKFAATEEESGRGEYEDLGPQDENEPPLTEETFVRALRKLKTGKACGPDGIPSEVFKNCEEAARELYNVLRII